MSLRPTTIGAAHDYGVIRDALNTTGRPIFFSTCGHSGPKAGPRSPDWMGRASSGSQSHSDAV
jgi:hypothetical protein